MNGKYRWILEIIDGRRDDFIGVSVRALLYVLSLVYRVAVKIRNWAFDCGWLKVWSVNRAVVSIGNLTVGGTGKTPMVIWLAGQLQKDHTIAVVGRGYGAVGDQLNDEGIEIAQQLPGITQVQNSNRVLAAKQAISQMGDNCSAQIIILDDGFQHRRLDRELDIVLIDATNPFGFGSLLPRGLLREPIESIRRAQIAVLTRSNLVSASVRADIQRRLMLMQPNLVWAETKLVVCGLQNLAGEQLPLEHLTGKSVLAFCGIGNPSGFYQVLKQSQISMERSIEFPDHHAYTQTDLQKIAAAANQSGCDVAICTQKDMVKLDRFANANTTVANETVTHFDVAKIDCQILSVVTEIRFLVGERELLDKVESLLSRYTKK